MPLICSKCDEPMKEPEASAFMNQYTDKITYSQKPEMADALPVHMHHKCRLTIKIIPKVVLIASNIRGKGPLGIVR